MPVRHIYPPAERLDVGSVALCGHVKNTAWTGNAYQGDRDGDRCLVCLDLFRAVA